MRRRFLIVGMIAAPLSAAHAAELCQITVNGVCQPPTLTADQTAAAISQAVTAVQAQIPQAASTVPPTENPMGAAGTPGTYRPGNAVQPRITRSKTVVLDANGAATFDWTSQGALTMQVQAAVTPVFTGSGVPKCWVTAISSTSVSIKCVMETASLVTVATVNVATLTNGSAAGLTVGIIVLPTS